MKTLIALITLAATNAFAFPQVEKYDCHGPLMTSPASKFVSVSTNPAKETLTYSVYALNGARLPIVLNITDVNPEGMEYMVDAKRDARLVDGALINATLKISLESYAPTKTHPAVIEIETLPLRGPARKVSYDLTCTEQN